MKPSKSFAFGPLFKATVLIAIGMIVSACGGGSGGLPGLQTPSSSGSSDDPNGPIAITSVSVTGSGTSNGSVLINPGVNNGDFTITYTVSGSGAELSNGVGYLGEAYVNLSGTFSGGTPGSNDYEIEYGCGKTSTTDSCKATVTYNCSIDNSNLVTCKDADPAVLPYTRSISSLITANPQNAYIVVYACDALGTQCANSAVAVTFE